MGSKWIEVSLDEISDRIGDGLHGTPVYSDSGEYFFINGNNLENGQIVFKDSTNKIDYEQYIKHKKDLGGNTILVSINGTIGNVALYSGEPILLGKSACYINLKKGISKYFIQFILSGYIFQEYIQRCSTGSTIKNVSLKMMREFRFMMPESEDEQNKSVEILKNLNQKMTLNRQINQTLEQMAQTLFKSWFVDFDPVIDNALDAGNDIPDALQERADQRRLLRAKADFKPLPAETRALFPSEFEENELGWVPKGWEVQAFSEISYILNGCAFKSGDYVEHGNFVLRTRNFTNNQVERYSDDVFLPDSFFESHSQFLCKPYDYHLVMVGASVGNCAIIYPHQLPAFRNQNMWCFRSKKPDFISQSFIKYLLDFVVTKSLGLASGSAREFFRKGDFGDQLVCSGVSDIQILFKNICESYLSKMSMLCAENESLIQLRDSLLPKLISGELVLDALPEVPELAEAF